MGGFLQWRSHDQGVNSHLLMPCVLQRTVVIFTPFTFLHVAVGGANAFFCYIVLYNETFSNITVLLKYI